MEYPKRKPNRLPGYDYSTANYYYITICTAGHRCLFGTPIRSNPLGKIVQNELENIPLHYEDVTVDKYVVMPNHVHMIFVLGCSNHSSEIPSLSDVVGKFKAGVSRIIHKTYPGLAVWQSRYYDEIIRNEGHYLAVWNYIDGNPSKWMEDKYYIR